MSTESKELSYLGHIDSLRAIAVLLVLVFHLESGLQGGFIGVDVFFVISGFLITRKLSNEFSVYGRINFSRFYLARARRLLPTLFLTIGSTIVLAFLVFSPSDFINATKSALMSSLALSNFYFLGRSGYFDNSSNFEPLLHTWSLGVEEQFYLLYPLTFFLLMRAFAKRRDFAVGSLGILFGIGVLLTFYTSSYGLPESISDFLFALNITSPEVETVQFYLFPFRISEFLIGGILAVVSVPKVKSESLKAAITLLGFLMIGVPAMLYSKDTFNLALLTLVPCIGAGALLFFLHRNFFSLSIKTNFSYI